jgi:hypothetical protein
VPYIRSGVPGLEAFSDLKETCVGQSAFTDLTLRSVITSNSPVWRKCVRKGLRPAAAVRNGESECTPRWRTSQNRDSGNTGGRSYQR